MTKSYVRPLIGLVSAAFVAGSLSVPASAQAPDSSSMSTTRPQTQSRPTRANRADDQRRICVRADFTESRIPRTICKTAAEWEAEGGLPTEE